MDFAQIREMPTTLGTGPNGQRHHESVFRSFQVVQKTRELLAQKVPHDVLLEIIDDMMDAPGVDHEIK